MLYFKELRNKIHSI